MQLRFIQVDADPFNRLQLSQLLEKFDGLINKGVFLNPVDALEYLKFHRVDVIFLASQLPVYSGFEFIEKLKDNIPIVLIAKKSLDAFKAFEYDLLDCIAQPVTGQRIEKSIQKLNTYIKKQDIIKQTETHYLSIKSNFKNEKIALDHIQYIQAAGDYVKIITTEKSFVIHSSMKAILTKLPEKQFQRIHKSYIVNLKHVLHFSANAVMLPGKSLPLSRNQKKYFRKQYEAFQ